MLSLTVQLALGVAGIGDRVASSFLTYSERPLLAKDAVKQGWASTGPCVKGLGYGYTKSPSPVTLYYSASGQMSGLGVEVFGTVQDALVAQGFFSPKPSSKTHEIAVGFRESDVCDATNTFVEPVGTGVIINPHTIAYSIPTSTTAAAAAKYNKGSCFDAMGVHWMFDLNTAPAMSWNASAVVPVIPMYWPGADEEQHLASILFASTSNETAYSADWDATGALPNELMCANTCDAACTFSGTSVWSTMHLFFHDPNKLVCDRSKYQCLPTPPAPLPGVGCCETPVVEMK